MPTGIGGEIGWWCPSLDDSGNGTTTLNDLTGNARSGTLTNFALTGSTSNWVTDTDSGGVRALDFDGSNDFVLVSAFPSALLSSNFAISFWAKANFVWGGTAAVRVPIGYGSNENMGVTNQHIFATYSAAFFMAGNGSYPVIKMSTFPAANVWAHVVAVWSGTTMSIYLNGTLQGSVANATFGTVAGTNLTFGRGSGAGNSFPGRMDDIRIFPSASIDSTKITLLASQRGYQPASSDFEAAGMFGGMSGSMTGGMAS